MTASQGKNWSIRLRGEGRGWALVLHEPEDVACRVGERAGRADANTASLYYARTNTDAALALLLHAASSETLESIISAVGKALGVDTANTPYGQLMAAHCALRAWGDSATSEDPDAQSR